MEHRLIEPSSTLLRLAIANRQVQNPVLLDSKQRVGRYVERIAEVFTAVSETWLVHFMPQPTAAHADT